MQLSDPDHEARRTLARHRAFATGLLILMGVLMLASYALPTSWASGLLQSAAKSGVVGGIADWFAVTALFRHPLGLPIPHTAIIPAQKARLGQALGRFVANHVFTPEDVARTLVHLDLPGILRRFLGDPASAVPASHALARLVPRLLGSVEDGRARRVLARLMPRLLGGAGTGAVVARALHGMVDGGRHQEMFGLLLNALRTVLATKEGQLQTAIEERVREQGGRLVGWALGAQIARRTLATLNAELERMGPDGSELRLAFDAWVRREIALMEDDPERAREIGAAIRRVLAHPAAQAWIWDVWMRLRAAIEADAANPGGHTAAIIQGALANLGAILEHDPAVRDRFHAAASSIVVSVLPAARASLSDFIAGVVANWDAATITERLELRVGKDLQYVRVNGTLVGFLVGGALYAALRAGLGVAGF